MTYEAIQLQARTAQPGLRLLCLLVKNRNGETRSLPIHTLRPMPPRVCSTDTHIKGRPSFWHLDTVDFAVAGDTGLYLRETHSQPAPSAVLARCREHRQASALCAHSRTVRACGVTA
jgi:hypothetical protein